MALATFTETATLSRFAEYEDIVKSELLIASGPVGGFNGTLIANDLFGWAVAALGDLDGDSIPDVAVGAIGDNDGTGVDTGAVYILFMLRDGSVKDFQKISNDHAGLNASVFDDSSFFGGAISRLGDIDGINTTIEIAVGADQDGDGGPVRGAVWILSLLSTGNVSWITKISNTSGGVSLDIKDNDHFGSGVHSPGDINGDGIPDLVIGSTNADEGGDTEAGEIHIIFMNGDGTPASAVEIQASSVVTGVLMNARFGKAIATLGDLDHNGVPDIAVSAYTEEIAGIANRGAIYVLFLTSAGNIISAKTEKIAYQEGGFQGFIALEDNFGNAITNIGDLDGDSTNDILVGAWLDDTHNCINTACNYGAVWLLLMYPTGTVKAEYKFGQGVGGFTGTPGAGVRFGTGITAIGDLDGDEVQDAIVGAPFSNSPQPTAGSVWTVFMGGEITRNRDSSDIIADELRLSRLTQD